MDSPQKKLLVDINKIVGLDPYIHDQFVKLQQVTVKAINSQEFRHRCLNFEYNYTSGRWWWKKTFTRKNFNRNSGDNRARILEKFMSGKDQFNKKADGDIDLYTTFYFSNNNTIGYTFGNTYKTWINKKFFLYRMETPEGRCKVIGNVIHEYMHNLGYSHSVRWNSSRQYTVPYAYGYIAEDVALQYI